MLKVWGTHTPLGYAYRQEACNLWVSGRN